MTNSSLKQQPKSVILLNKPYGVLCQFTDSEGRPTLADYIKEPDFYAAGRLDMDSEGLLVLTDDGVLQNQLSDPKHKLAKTYWVQVEGIADENALRQLRDGVMIQGKKTLPAEVRTMDQPDALWTRDPPIRFRKNVADSWIEIKLTEGRNRQVKRMTAVVGHPTLRLIRYAVGNWTLDNIDSGCWLKMSVNE